MSPMKQLVISIIFCLFILSNAAQAQKSDAESLIPILGNYPNKSVPVGGSATVSPDTGASSVGAATVSVAGNFKGSLTVSPSSGAVRVLNAYPAGTYAVTVRASDFAGFTVVRSFNLTVTNISSCNTLDFAGIRTAVGTSAVSVAAADFNGDGRQDTATANNISNNISVLLGNGAGSFGTVTNFALPVNTFAPQTVAVGDFNGDNKADLAVRTFLNSGNISQITVFNGTGTGSFGAPVNYSLGTTAGSYGIAVGDYNGDGRMDIATGNSGSSSVAILFRNAANNGFDAVTNINPGFTGNSLAAADFNTDGRHDLVVSRSGANSVTAFIRNGANNGFDQVNLTVNVSPNQVIVGDFTGDGRQDIAASGGSLDILPRNALGFDAPVNSGFSVGVQMQAGDFNNDGRLDIAYSSGSQTFIAYRNAANTNFDSPTNIGSATGSINSLAAADFTGDGRLDLAALNFVNNAPGGIFVFRRNGTNTNFDLSPIQSFGSNNFTDAALGDFDNDGRQDLAFATAGLSNIPIYKGSGNGNLTNLTTAVLNSGNVSSGAIAAADFTGDGNTDLLVGNNTNNGFSLFAGAGNGSFAAAFDFTLGFQPQRFVVGDFNGDERQDFALNRPNSNQTVIFLRNAANSGFDAAVTITLSTTVNSSLIVGDFNNDGNDDLATGFAFSNGFSVVLRNAINNGFDAPVFYSAMANQNGQLTAADFDGDGNQDIAYSSNGILVFAGSATGTFGAPTVAFGGGIGTGFVESGDFNGDGRTDIVAATSNYFISFGRANVAVLLRNAANNGFDAPVGFNGSYINNNSVTQKIIVGEINGDGRQDLLTSNGTNNSNIAANFSVMPRVCTVDLNLLGALPNGAAGQSYSKTIYVSGGIAPYNFTISGLPSGLNYSTTADSVTIFGTPSMGGQFNVSIAVADSNPLLESNIAPQAANALTQVLPLQVAFAPTAANVSISGRVLTADGRAVSGAIVTLTDRNGTTRTARTSSFGVFRFEEVEAGEIYVASVVSKRFQFEPQLVSVFEDVTDLNFTAIE